MIELERSFTMAKHLALTISFLLILGIFLGIFFVLKHLLHSSRKAAIIVLVMIAIFSAIGTYTKVRIVQEREKKEITGIIESPLVVYDINTEHIDIENLVPFSATYVPFTESYITTERGRIDFTQGAIDDVIRPFTDQNNCQYGFLDSYFGYLGRRALDEPTIFLPCRVWYEANGKKLLSNAEIKVINHHDENLPFIGIINNTVIIYKVKVSRGYHYTGTLEEGAADIVEFMSNAWIIPKEELINIRFPHYNAVH